MPAVLRAAPGERPDRIRSSPPHDRRQQIVEIMRDMPGQLAQHLHLLQLTQGVLRTMQLIRPLPHALVQLRVQSLQRGEEPAIFESRAGGARQSFQQRYLIVGRHSRFGPIGTDRRDGFGATDRHHDHAAHVGPAIGVDGHARIGQHIGDDDRLLVRHRPTRNAATDGKIFSGPQRLGRILRDIMASIVVAEHDGDSVRPHRPPGKCAQHRCDGVHGARTGKRFHRFGSQAPACRECLMLRSVIASDFATHRAPFSSPAGSEMKSIALKLRPSPKPMRRDCSTLVENRP